MEAASPEPPLPSSAVRRPRPAAKRGWIRQPERSSKRAYKSVLERAASVDSDCTQQGGQASEAKEETVAGWLMPQAGGGSASHGAAAELLSAEGSQGSGQSRLSIRVVPAAAGFRSPPSACCSGSTAGPAASCAPGKQALPSLGSHTRTAGEAGGSAAADQVQPAELVTKAYRAELAAANETLKRLPLPGSQQFWPVHHSCAMLPLCAAYEVSPAAVALGASYFQRLLASSQELGGGAVSCGFFSLQQQPGAPAGCQEWVMHAQPGCPHLLAVLCTCIYLGVKVTEGPRYGRQLSSMLGDVLRRKVPTEQAAEMELRCLDKLGWRLGPYRCANSLP